MTGTMARCWMAEGRSKLKMSQMEGRVDGGKDSPVCIDTSKQLWCQLHVVETASLSEQVLDNLNA